MKASSKYTEGFGERMRYLRRKDKLKQNELAEKLNVTRQSISGYETERMIPSTRVIEKMCDLYGINPWWLMYGVGSSSSEKGEEISLMSSAPYEEVLTDTQRTLINYIKSDKESAKQLAKLLWDRAVKL
ncbi:MAG: helix-turn-helix transcriptional regulator [Fidelibacterota bacterium]|nr:MAG: helix-turn-helix transcriptional regulator [Candidatus Neomarinimicrobiota bacterium]